MVRSRSRRSRRHSKSHRTRRYRSTLTNIKTPNDVIQYIRDNGITDELIQLLKSSSDDQFNKFKDKWIDEMIRAQSSPPVPQMGNAAAGDDSPHVLDTDNPYNALLEQKHAELQATRAEIALLRIRLAALGVEDALEVPLR